MSSDLYERVTFLSQAAEYLSAQGERGEARLGSYYQLTGREIRLKNQVSCFGWDSLKRNCCKTCFISLNHPKTASLKTRKGSLIVKCLNCNSSRKHFPVRTERKTYYEKLLHGDRTRPHHHEDESETNDKMKNPKAGPAVNSDATQTETSEKEVVIKT
jgi:RNase P subunit RPR2